MHKGAKLLNSPPLTLPKTALPTTIKVFVPGPSTGRWRVLSVYSPITAEPCTEMCHVSGTRITQAPKTASALIVASSPSISAFVKSIPTSPKIASSVVPVKFLDVMGRLNVPKTAETSAGVFCGWFFRYVGHSSRPAPRTLCASHQWRNPKVRTTIQIPQ